MLVCQNLNGVVSINVHNKLQAPFDFVCFKFIVESCSFWDFFVSTKLEICLSIKAHSQNL